MGYFLQSGAYREPVTDRELQEWWPDLGTVVAELRRINRGSVADSLLHAVRAGTMSSEIFGGVGVVLQTHDALRTEFSDAAVSAWDAVMADVHRAFPGSLAATRVARLTGAGTALWILVRALTYTTLFVGFLLVFLPSRVLSQSGVTTVPDIGAWQVLGMMLTGAGAALVLWSLLTFVFVGRGTAAPFDPPRRLVVRGPYRIVRNPIYIGAGLALVGAVLFYRSIALAAYAVLLGLITQILVVSYEEPTLRRTFGDEYEAYCRRVARWWPSARGR